MNDIENRFVQLGLQAQNICHQIGDAITDHHPNTDKIMLSQRVIRLLQVANTSGVLLAGPGDLYDGVSLSIYGIPVSSVSFPSRVATLWSQGKIIDVILLQPTAREPT